MLQYKTGTVHGLAKLSWKKKRVKKKAKAEDVISAIIIMTDGISIHEPQDCYSLMVLNNVPWVSVV